MSVYGVLKDDIFENAIIKRIQNMHADFQYINKANQKDVYKWVFHNPIGNIWDLRINLRFEYVNKKIDENYEKELRRLMS